MGRNRLFGLGSLPLSPRRVNGPITSFSNGQFPALESLGSELANSLLGQTLLNLKTSFKRGGMMFCAKTGFCLKMESPRILLGNVCVARLRWLCTKAFEILAPERRQPKKKGHKGQVAETINVYQHHKTNP